MSVEDDSDLDNFTGVRMACCWTCGWKCGQRRNDRCTGLYHELVESLNRMYPPGDLYLVDPRGSWKFGSLARSGPIAQQSGDDKGTVWIPEWQGHPVSFVQSSVVQEADEKRRQDQVRYAFLKEEVAKLNRHLTFLQECRNRRDDDMLDEDEEACLVEEEALLNGYLTFLQECLAERSNTVRLTPARQRMSTRNTAEVEYSEIDDVETTEERAERLLKYHLRKPFSCV